MNNELRKKYICKAPFTYTEISDGAQWLCCPSWLPANIMESTDYKTNWYSEKSQKIRESILNGSYEYCNNKLCPYLSALDNGKIIPSLFIEKEKFFDLKLDNPKPSIINMGFDQSCNLQCPSCRLQFINYKGLARTKVDNTIIKISKELGEYVDSLILCGGADPFFSKSFLNFMKNFNKTDFPNIKHIHLLTNGTLWTKKVWGTMKNIHPYVKSCEISIDAATKNTYENKVRLNGDWDKLLDNIQFILTIPTIKKIRFSFVVQKNNYKEMYDFYCLVQQITSGTTKRVEILYNAIVDWGSYKTKSDFEKEEIHNPNHPLFNDFLLELDKIKNLNVNHNFGHLVKSTKTLI